MIKRTERFITEEERQALETTFKCSGMSAEHGIDLKTGEFCRS